MIPLEASERHILETGNFVRVNDNKIGLVSLMGFSTFLIKIDKRTYEFFYTGRPLQGPSIFDKLDVKCELTKEDYPELFL